MLTGLLVCVGLIYSFFFGSVFLRANERDSVALFSIFVAKKIYSRTHINVDPEAEEHGTAPFRNSSTSAR
jgi:hypothetical protein